MGLATVIIREDGTIKPTDKPQTDLNALHSRCLLGWSTWRDWFYMNVLPGKPDDIPLSSHVRKTITACLFSENDELKSNYGTN
jgi:hypothetical protein